MDKDYKSKFAISQSAIKDWRNMSPNKWNHTWILRDVPRKAAGVSADFGSLLDCMILTPANVEKQYLVSSGGLPSDNIQKVIEKVYNNLNSLNQNAINLNKKSKVKIPIKDMVLDHKELIEAAAIELDYFANTPTRAYNEVMKHEYFFTLLKENKKVVSEKDFKLATELKTILLESKVSRGFFIPKKGCRIVFQQKIYADLELSGFDNLDFMPMKGAIDIIYFNDAKEEVREIDLKWTNDAFLFTIAVKQFDYPAQHSVYDFLLREWLKTYEKGKYAHYTVAPPLNVVIDSDDKVPYIYTYSMDDLNIKRYGHSSMPWVKGWEQTVNEIAWHMDTQQWERPKEHYLNGFIPVNVFNK